MESYVIRIYRRNAMRVPTCGLVEMPLARETFSFANREELWSILVDHGLVEDKPDPAPGFESDNDAEPGS